MVFSSILFIFRFLPIALGIYFITPKKYRNFVLIILSLIFYSWGEAKYFVIMIASILVDYFASKGIDKYRDNKKIRVGLLILSVCFNLGMLFFFKYINFFIDNINMIFNMSLRYVRVTLPLGISFYTFQTMSYTIDVFRGKVKTARNIIDFGAFVTLFPQLIAGPIVTYADIEKELPDRKVDLNQIEDGIELFIFGLGKKVLIANSIGMLWTEVEKIGVGSVSSVLAWLGVLAFALQIYFDFSGYSLMAIGLGKMLGFNFPSNFNYPYISRSMTEFWRRWHITLGHWFREYVYIPMGGNRVSKGRLYFNLFVVWFLTGFWHGANYNFIIWGLYFFVLLSVEKAWLLKFLENKKILSHIYSIFAILVGWALFAVVDLRELGNLFKTLFTAQGGLDWVYYIRNYGVTILIGIIFSMPIVERVYNRYIKNNALRIILLLGILLLSVAYLVDATYNPFLYFRF